MILPDVNILVYAFSTAAENHERFREWLEETIESPEAYGVSELVLSSFVRVVTHPRVLDPPATLDQALRFCEILRTQPNAVVVAPGPRHWEIFTNLSRAAGVRGNLVTDAYLAAMAIESGCEMITTDRDFSRFHGLRWRHPLQ